MLDFETIPESVDATDQALKNLSNPAVSALVSPQLLSRPPFSFLSTLITTIVAKHPLIKLFTADEVSPPSPPTKPDKLKFLIKILEAVSQITDTRVDIFVIPAKVIAGQDVLQTLLFIREVCKCTRRDDAIAEKVVDNVLETGEIALYQRSVGVRKTVLRMQAIMRGKNERKRATLVPNLNKTTPPPSATPLPSTTPAPVDDFFAKGLLKLVPSNTNVTSPPPQNASRPDSGSTEASQPLSTSSTPAASSPRDETNLMMMTVAGPRQSPGANKLMNLQEESVDLSQSNVQLAELAIPTAKKRGLPNSGKQRATKVMPFNTKVRANAERMQSEATGEERSVAHAPVHAPVHAAAHSL